MKCDLCGGERLSTFASKHGLDYLECGDCGFVFTDTRDFDFGEHNEELISGMEDTHRSKHASTRHLKAYDAHLKEFARYRQKGTLLEVGCSTGAFLQRAEQHNWQVTGVEPVASSAQVGIDEHGLDIHVGTLDDVEFEAGSFDVVYSNAVIEHVANPSGFIAEAHRLLREGGLFYADTVNLDSYTWKFLGTRWKLFDPRMHLSLFTPASLSEACAAVGFTVDKVTTHGVRFHAGRDDRPSGLGRLADELRKTPYSIAARRTGRGDNMAIYATKA